MSESVSPVFALAGVVLPNDIDELGRVNNGVYLRWVQAAAVAHWRAIAPASEQLAVVWVVLRHEIDYKIAALAEDEILLRTWVGKATRLTFERFTEIIRRDGKLLAQARTLWCPIDPETHRPKRVSPGLRAQFST
ncbi:MAG: acyl-CoA thioesterase [Chthoniobacterales bacterium]